MGQASSCHHRGGPCHPRPPTPAGRQGLAGSGLPSSWPARSFPQGLTRLQVNLSPNEVLIPLFFIQATIVCFALEPACARWGSVLQLPDLKLSPSHSPCPISPSSNSQCLRSEEASSTEEQRGLLMDKVPDGRPHARTGRTRTRALFFRVGSVSGLRWVQEQTGDTSNLPALGCRK